MATIRRKGNKWQAIVRRSGRPTCSRTFHLKSDASEWARATEVSYDRQTFNHFVPNHHKFKIRYIFEKYRDEIVPKKRGAAEVETYIINAILKNSFVDTNLEHAYSCVFAAYRDKRREKVKAATVNRELGLMSHAFNVAIKEWGISISSNPLLNVTRLKNLGSRNRRLVGEEFTNLIAASADCRNIFVRPAIELAIETGMRRGELLDMNWDNINLPKRLAYVAKSKNGYSRTIPLTSRAIEVLSGLNRTSEIKVIPITTNSLKLAWVRLRKRASIEDLHFHDLRHEAISRFFEMGLRVPEVALISGHKDYRMLARYTHLRAEDVVKKLR